MRTGLAPRHTVQLDLWLRAREQMCATPTSPPARPACSAPSRSRLGGAAAAETPIRSRRYLPFSRVCNMTRSRGRLSPKKDVASAWRRAKAGAAFALLPVRAARGVRATISPSRAPPLLPRDGPPLATRGLRPGPQGFECARSLDCQPPSGPLDIDCAPDRPAAARSAPPAPFPLNPSFPRPGHRERARPAPRSPSLATGLLCPSALTKFKATRSTPPAALYPQGCILRQAR